MTELRKGDIHVWRADAFTPAGIVAICSRYLGRRCCLVRSALGKPFIAGGELEIGVAHTEGAAVLAISRRAVGIDAERMAPLPDLDSLARASLAPSEYLGLERAGADRTAWFYRCWVRKEALLKARGCGLAVDPREVETTAAPAGWTWIDATLDGAIAVAIATPDPWAKVTWMTAGGAGPPALSRAAPIWHDACTKP